MIVADSQRLHEEIHLYRLDLHGDTAAPAADWALLNPAERERAHHLRQVQARECFVRVRAALRRLLAAYVQCEAAELAFSVGCHGKPRLAGSAPDSGVVFNLSHSGACALIALTRDAALGVDVEQHRPLHQQDALARRCFAAEEWAWWQSLSPHQRETGFFRLWACKEAFAKATGIGISLGLRRVAVDVSASARLIAVPPTQGVATGWQLQELMLGADYSGAICHDGAKRRLLVVNGADYVASC